jgi:hypothetical protein
MLAHAFAQGKISSINRAAARVLVTPERPGALTVVVATERTPGHMMPRATHASPCTRHGAP